MSIILDIKDQFITKEAFEVYSACMYKPTWELFYKRASALVNDENISVFGYCEYNNILGIISIKQHNDQYYEIYGIAVNPYNRRKGIGKRLVQYVLDNLCSYMLYAETDDASIGFYKQLGFKIEEYFKKYGNDIYKRYKCTIYK